MNNELVRAKFRRVSAVSVATAPRLTETTEFNDVVTFFFMDTFSFEKRHDLVPSRNPILNHTQ